jgi:hypothetical protein
MSQRVHSPVLCINLNGHVALKLHAGTGPFSNERVRDNLDILLIDLCRRQDIDEVRAA